MERDPRLIEMNKRYEKEKEELLKKIEEEEAAKISNDEKEVAALLHATFCTSSHTDQCGWFYETWGNMGYSRKRYLSKAQQLLPLISISTLKEILKVLKGI